MSRIFMIQLIGYIALFFLVLRFFYDERKRILSLSALANFIQSIHLFLLGGITGAGMTFIAAVGTLVFRERTSKKWAQSCYWLYFFLLLIIAVGILTWGGFISLLPISGSITTTLALWSKKTKTIRLLSASAMAPWFAYAYIIGSPPVMMSTALVFCSSLFNMIRFDRKK
jgi:hypothetical protein